MTYEDLLWVQSPSAVTIDEETVAEGAYKGTWRAHGLRYLSAAYLEGREVPQDAITYC